jgi:hypothetical protein
MAAVVSTFNVENLAEHAMAQLLDDLKSSTHQRSISQVEGSLVGELTISNYSFSEASEFLAVLMHFIVLHILIVSIDEQLIRVRDLLCTSHFTISFATG